MYTDFAKPILCIGRVEAVSESNEVMLIEAIFSLPHLIDGDC